MTLKLSRPEFERLVQAALREMPAKFRQFMEKENVAVVVTRRPSPQKLLDLGMNPAVHILYGLYEGTPRTARTTGYNLTVPDKITIYQEALESQYPGRAALKEQVRRTVLHEVAHFFGFSDAELTAMGWG